MSETQQRVTRNFEAYDDGGAHFHVVEYETFRHTTTAHAAFGDDGAKTYKLANGAPLRRISDTEFEIESSGTKIRIR